MRIRLGVDPSLDVHTMGEAIDAALEASTVSQVPLLRDGKIPDIRDAIEKGKVEWKPEPPGDEHFDDAKTVLQRGWGDCDDLAPWLAASLRASGEAPDARAFVYQSGPKRFHAVVDDGTGKVLDPSKWAGMLKRRVSGVAPVWQPMFPGQLALATHPYLGGVAARVDVPDASVPVAWSTVVHHPNAARAVGIAATRAAQFADCAGEPFYDDLVRLHGLGALLGGVDVHVVGDIMGDIAYELGEDGIAQLMPAARAFGGPVGFSFGKLLKSVASPLKGVVSKGLQFVPGVGPIASTAFDMSMKAADTLKAGKGVANALKSGNGKRAVVPPPPAGVTAPGPATLRAAQTKPGTAMAMPGGVVIVRF